MKRRRRGCVEASQSAAGFSGPGPGPAMAFKNGKKKQKGAMSAVTAAQEVRQRCSHAPFVLARILTAIWVQARLNGDLMTAGADMDHTISSPLMHSTQPALRTRVLAALHCCAPPTQPAVMCRLGRDIYGRIAPRAVLPLAGSSCAAEHESRS